MEFIGAICYMIEVVVDFTGNLNGLFKSNKMDYCVYKSKVNSMHQKVADTCGLCYNVADDVDGRLSSDFSVIKIMHRIYTKI